ncbi:ribosomal prt S8 [Nucleospora cyclopteri]
MGITTCGRHKSKKTGGKRNKMQKKRKNMMGRQPSNTRIGEERIKQVRCRGGNYKMRCLRINYGDFSIYNGNEYFNDKTNIEQVIYHPSSNELMRTNTITKSAVVKIKATEGMKEAVKSLSTKFTDKVLNVMAERGFFYAIITSRPGQCGNISGYVLQGEELEFYQNKLKKGRIEV